MADYVSIIAKAVSALAENTAANRQVIYQKARDTIDRKLRAMNPMPAEASIAAQMQQLESAIQQVETDELASMASPEIEESPPAAIPQITPIAQQAGSTSVLPEAADTPILIDGIGDKTLQHLADEGITRVSQIAAMSDGELAALTEKIGIPGFERTQEWKEQASALLAGHAPRSKTDQERLKKILEEAEGATDDAFAVVPPEDAGAAFAGEQAALRDAAEQPEVVVASPEPVQPDIPVAPEPPAPPRGSIFADPVANPESPFDRPAAPEPASIEIVPEPRTTQPPTAEPTVMAPPVEEPSAAGWMEQPVSPGDPAPSEAGHQPEYVSELDGDPLLELERASSRTVPPPRRKGGAGKVAGWLFTLLLVGAVGAGAYYYQDELKQAGGQAVEAVSGLIGGGDAESTATPEQAADTAAGEKASAKDTSRLGNGGETRSEASTETAQAPAGQSAVRDVTPPDTATEPVMKSDEPVQLVEPADGGNLAASQVNAGEPSATTGESGGETAQNDTQPLPGSPGDAQQPAVLAGEKAFLYEEGFGANGASRDDGAVSWTLVNEPPEEGSAPEAVIKGVMEVPARGLQLNLTIKRNVDAALPASHIIELFFSVPPGFSGGNIDQISRFVMKSTEQARGESLVGVPARIDAGYFLIALNNLDQAQQTNLGLLETANWIDVPITYLTGRRGLVTLEKGVAGKKVFADALADWRNR